jgi:RHS repeat-associated protein
VDFPTFYRTFVYDGLQQIRKVEEFDYNDNSNSLRSLTYTYDLLGNITSVTDKKGGVRTNTYDALGRWIKTIDVDGDVTEFKYDVRDNMIELKDPRGNVSRYTYDSTNRRISVTTPEGKCTTYSYGNETVDAKNFRTVTEIRPSGDKIKSWINAIGQVEKREYCKKKDDNSFWVEDTCQYTYDSLGKVLSATGVTYDSDGVEIARSSVSFTYDALGRKLSETTNYGLFSKTNSYTYNPNGSLASYTGPDGITYSYAYDEANRLTSINIPGNGNVVYNSYRWNSPLQMTLPGGAKINYDHDGLMRATGIEARDPFGNLISKLEYEYNSEGNITVKNTESFNVDYVYDSSSSLTTVSVTPNETNAPNEPVPLNETFTYDSLGNRIRDNNSTENWIYNSDNQLISTPQATYAYDFNGNMTRKTVGGVSTFYIWNVKGQLVEVKEGVTLDNSTTIATYTYDPFGRRISKMFNGTKAYFFYNNWKLCGEYAENGDELRSYVYASNSAESFLIIDENIHSENENELHSQASSQSSMAPLFIRQNGEYYYYLNDHLGTPQKIISSSGRIVWSVMYSAFGRLTAVKEIENNIRFPGQYFDDETGLHYNLFRYYDSDTGRYISADPAGIDGGLNLYAYVYNNPISNFDNYGLCPQCGEPGYGHKPTCPAITGSGGQGGGGAIRGGGGAGAAKGSCGGILKNITGFLSDVKVISRGKVIGKGTVDVRPTLEGIQCGKIQPRDIFQNREGLLPKKPDGYYKEFVLPTPGVNDAGSQRIILGEGGELYYTPDHYKTFIPLN